MGAHPDNPYVSRGGLKLARALEAFALDVTNLRCADLGCSTGGFTDCLLQHGAASVVSVDTGYGVLDWKLRNDPRVLVRERTNALHALPAHPPVRGREHIPPGPVDLVVLDMSWTPLRLCIPAALRWILPGGKIVTLVKPHYEADEPTKREHLRKGILDDDAALRVAEGVRATLPALGVQVRGWTISPIRGSSKGPGNLEWLALLEPAAPPVPEATQSPGSASGEPGEPVS